MRSNDVFDAGGLRCCLWLVVHLSRSRLTIYVCLYKVTTR